MRLAARLLVRVSRDGPCLSSALGANMSGQRRRQQRHNLRQHEERAASPEAARLSSQRPQTPVRSSTPVSVALLRPRAARSPDVRTSLEHLHRFARAAAIARSVNLRA
jgi:hypothetical protein